MSLTSTSPLNLADLVQAGASVDGTLVPRTLLDGWALQLVGLPPDGDPGGVPPAVLTVEVSRQITDRFDLERLTGSTGLPAQADVWFTEATAPWGPVGEVGVAIVWELARLLSARLIVEDGQ